VRTESLEKGKKAGVKEEGGMERGSTEFGWDGGRVFFGLK